MNIRLKNIGIVKDSKIELSGLTVITGKNNSGKTTVGKSLYALLDAVSNLNAKARVDRNYYIKEKLDDVSEKLRVLRLTRTFYRDEFSTVLKDYPAMVQMSKRDYEWTGSIESYAHALCNELRTFDVSKIDKRVLERYIYPGEIRKENISAQELLNEQVQKAIAILEQLDEELQKDPELIDYARESINQTLCMEFSSQIQPVAGCQGNSEIELTEENAVSFKLEINDNKVLNTGVPVYFGTQYKRAYFVDDPFILDRTSAYPRIRANYVSEVEYMSLLNPNRIISHSDKLTRILHGRTTQTVLEQTLSNQAIAHVKERMDAILPGTFDFSANGEFYVHNGKKLSVSNLATGSKMFSIVKLLLEKGELDNATMLILDEPEAHLHPMWQNYFAEIIVLLVKELNVNILLTTHSPNFMLALDAYMRKYQLEEKTNFYQTNNTDDGFVEYSCVNDNISNIYADFLKYLSEVKVLRNLYLMDGEDDE